MGFTLIEDTPKEISRAIVKALTELNWYFDSIEEQTNFIEHYISCALFDKYCIYYLMDKPFIKVTFKTYNELGEPPPEPGYIFLMVEKLKREL